MSEPQAIPCLCPCGAKVGEFEPLEDHGGVVVRCPKCNNALEVPNGLLCQVLDFPEEYSLPLTLSEV